MKRFEDLTRDELVALGDDAINYYIDRECAERGLPLLPPAPPVAPDKGGLAPDVTHYLIPKSRFRTVEDAQAALAAINALPRIDAAYVRGYGYEKVEAAPDQPLQMTQERVYSRALANETESRRDDYGRLKAVYDREKEQYDKAYRGRETAAGSIRSAIGDAYDQSQTIKSLRHDHARYVQLANGDRAVAARFLEAAHGARYDNLRGLVPDLFLDDAGATIPVFVAPTAGAPEAPDDDI